MSRIPARIVRLAVAGAFAAFASSAFAQVEIQWWHSMTGALNDRVNEFAKGFNESQKDYKIVPVYKGSYPESMAAAIAAFRAGNAPHILQVFEVGTGTMMSAKGAIKPVQQVMTEAGEKFDPKSYIGAVAGYYTNRKGEMLSFPFNSSTTVFYYNKDVFEKAGLDPNRPPATWPEVMAAAAKIKASGASQCAYTTGWPSWVHVENLSRVAQRPDRHQGERDGGPRHPLRDQQPAARAALEQPEGMVAEGLLHLRRPHQRGRGEVLQRRVRDADVVVGGAGEHQPQREVQVRAWRCCRTTPTCRARRRTRSSAAPRCG